MSVTLHRFEAHTEQRCDPTLHADWRELPACHYRYENVTNHPFCGVPEDQHRYWRDVEAEALRAAQSRAVVEGKG